MKYRNTSRKGALLYLLNFITLGIFFLFFFIRIRREIKNFGKRGGMPYPVAWLLGFITLWIVPLIWFCNRAEEVGQAYERLELKGKHIDFAFMFIWLAFGSFIIVGPFIAFHRFFNSLNAIERATNVVVTKAATKLAVKEEKKEDEQAKADEAKAEEGKKEDKKEEEAVIANVDKPTSLRMPYIRYDHSHDELTGSYWCTKIDGKFYYFESQEDAIAFARRVAIDRGCNVTVLGKPENVKPKDDYAGKVLKLAPKGTRKPAPKPVMVTEAKEEASAPVA